MIVVDASVTNKLFLTNEEDYIKADSIFQKHILKREIIIVPSLLFYEVANTLATKSAIPISAAVKSLEDLYELGLEIYNPTFKDMIKASKFAKQYKVSVYDAIYAVLAKEKKCNLITADSKFVKQVSLSFVKDLAEYNG